MTKNFNIAVLALSISISLGACDRPLPRPNHEVSGETATQKSGTSNSNPKTVGGTASNGNPAPAASKSAILSLKLTPEASHDAYDYTFGVATVQLESATTDYSISVKRSLSTNAAASLDANQKSNLLRLCQDINLSDSASEAKEITEWKKGQNLYVVWRSHYSILTADAVSAAMLKGNSVQCILSIAFEAKDFKNTVNLVFNPISNSIEGLAGSAKLAEAIKEGLLLPLAASNETVYKNENLLEVTTPAQILFNVDALTAKDLIVKAVESPLEEQCYYAVTAGKTHVANPYARNSFSYEVSNGGDLGSLEVAARVVGGRSITQCDAIRKEFAPKAVKFDLSCAEYDAIKDQGLESGCAWDFIASNANDKENTIRAPIAMTKIAFKNVDPTKANQVIAIMPHSPLNPIRNGKTKLTGFKDSYKPLIEDAFDLWIAIDEETFRRDYLDWIQEIKFDQPCTYGGYTVYGSHLITWCGGGAMSDRDATNRLQDPSSTIYRAMLAHHEDLHARNYRHDLEVASYAPCSGTAFSAKIAFMLATRCEYDYCKVMRDMTIGNYKNELNYSYNGDNTGRKSQGLCKTWSTAMGITGSGF